MVKRWQNTWFLILLLAGTCFGTLGDFVMDNDGNLISWPNNGFTFTAAGSPSMSESMAIVFPPADGSAGQQLTTDGSNVWSWTDPTGDIAGAHTMLNNAGLHTNTAAGTTTRGGIMFVNSTPLWDELGISSTIGSPLTKVLGTDGTDSGFRTLANFALDIDSILDHDLLGGTALVDDSTVHDVRYYTETESDALLALYLKLDTSNDPLTNDLDFGGNDILSSGAIGFKVSGDNDDYLSISTPSNTPTIGIIGGNFFHITSESNAPGLRFFEDIDNNMLIGWTGGQAVIGSTHDLNLSTFANNGDITLTPHGTGVVNINSDLNMNDNPITNVGYLSFDLDAVVPNEEGNVGWNTEDGTFDVHMPGGTVTLQVGQEMLIRSRNDSGSDMTDGQLVFISGASGNKPQLTLAKADTEATSAKTIGMLTEDIDNNSNGYINTFGFVRDIKTDVDADSTALSEGDMLYLSENVAGGFTKTKPISPDHLVCIGYVIKTHATEGIIFIRVQNGFEVDELHDVLISSVADNELLVWDSASSTWQNQTPTEAGLDDRYYTQDEVNDLVEGNTFDFFLNNTNSDISAPIQYFVMDPTETGEAESTFSDTITGDDFLIDSWATSTSEPTFSALVSGIYSFHIHAETTTGANVGSVRLYWELYSRIADDPFTETLLITSEESNILVGVETEYDIHGILAADVILDATDRLVLKVYANIETSRPTDPLVTLTAEGTTAAHFEVVTTITAFDDRYVFVTGDTMTGPLNISNIISASSLNLKPSGNNDNYLSFSTVDGFPTTTIIGGNLWHIKSDRGAVGIEFLEDEDNFLFVQWIANTDTGLILSTGNITLTSIANNGNITLTPHGTGVVNIESDVNMGTNDITNPGDIDGGVNPAAITDIANLDAYWRGEDKTDSSGNSHTLDETAGTFTQGDRGASKFIKFDGTLEMDTITNYKGPLGDGDKSICFWIRTTAVGNETLWGYGNSAVAGEWVGVRISNGDGGETVGGMQWFFGNGNVNTDAAINDGLWHHLVIVWPADTGGTTHSNAVVYCDGVLDERVVNNGDRFSPASGNNFLLGDNPQGPATNAVWDCDEFAVYDGTALSAEQVLNIYNSQRERIIRGASNSQIDWTNADTALVTSKLGTFGEGLIIPNMLSILPVTGDIFLDAAGDMFFDADGDMFLGVDGDMFLTLGDAAGAKKVTIRDSDNNVVATIDSDGAITGTSFTDGTMSIVGGEILDATTLEATTQLNLEIGDVAQLNITDGKLAPTTDNDIDLGDATHGFKDAWFTGTLDLGTNTIADGELTGDWDFNNAEMADVRLIQFAVNGGFVSIENANTFFNMNGLAFIFATDGKQMMQIVTSDLTFVFRGVQVNPQSRSDVDFRVRGDSISELFFVDVSTDRVGINTNTPAVLLDVRGDADVLNDFTAGTIQADDGFTGSWVNQAGDTVTVVGGIITSVAP